MTHMKLMNSPDFESIPKLLATWAHAPAQDQARLALTFYQGRTLVHQWTYAELYQSIYRISRYLHETLGINCGDRVAVLSANRIELPALFFAIMYLGATIVPLNPTASPEDWSYILRHSGARGVFASPDLLESVASRHSVQGFILPIEELVTLNEASELIPSAEDFSKQIAVILYTSGTTGAPKGVALSQQSILANAWSMAQNFNLSRDTQLAVLPLYHAHAFGFGMMSALSTYGHLVFTDRLDPFAWAEIICTQEVVVTSVVPTLLPILLQTHVANRMRVPTLRAMLVSSAPLSPQVARDFEQQTSIPLIQGWGLSEYTNFACCMSPDNNLEDHQQLLFDEEVPSIGSPLLGTEVRVIDSQGQALSAGMRGELCVRGHSTMLSYYEDKEATQKAITSDGWLRTGDEGFYNVFRDKPIFFITGRLKELIIRGAEKYSPLALERTITAAIAELQGRLAIVGFPHQMHGEEIGAYIEIDLFPDTLREQLIQSIESMMPDQRPKVVLYGIQPIPRTHTGKVQRRKLVPLFEKFNTCRGRVQIVPS